jgi:transcriptional regulator with XRE-family HTH domain
VTAIRPRALAEFGFAVRYHRRAAGLSQGELAERCSIHRTYLGGIERGERNPSLLNMLRIAEALDVPVSQLVEGLTLRPDRRG